MQSIEIDESVRTLYVVSFLYMLKLNQWRPKEACLNLVTSAFIMGARELFNRHTLCIFLKGPCSSPADGSAFENYGFEIMWVYDYISTWRLKKVIIHSSIELKYAWGGIQKLKIALGLLRR